MAGYLGAKPAVNGIYTVDEFTSSGGTTYTLSRAPGTKNNIQVNAGGLAQYPSAYSVSGTTLTLSGVPSGQKVVVRHMGETILYPNLDDGIVTDAKLATDAVTTGKIAAGAVGTTDIADDAVSLAKMADDAVGVAQLSATGTASATTFLRGDNSWQAAGGGKVLQCLQAVQTAVVTTTSGSLVDVTGLTQAITPSSSASKILILVTVNSTADDSGSVFQLMRDTTEIFKADAGDSGEIVGSLSVYGSTGSTHMMSHASACFLDSPSTTSSTTFKLQWKSASGTNYLNRNRRDSGGNDTRTASSITVMEIGA